MIENDATNAIIGISENESNNKVTEEVDKPNVPAIRFKGFTDPWEQRKLGEVAHRVIRKNEGNQSDLPLTISAQHGLVDQRDYFNNQVASRDMSGYYLLENGEFAYNKSTSGDSPWGAIKRLTKYEKGCLSTLYICFGLDLGDPDFLVTYYETNRWHGAVQMIAAEGARNHGLLNIAPDDFFETVLTLPCSTEEQKQIGCFFTQLNSLITLHQRKCEKLKTFKKSMLEKMFPKPECDVPEIRFKGFTDPWEQRKLGELTSIKTGDSDLQDAVPDGRYPFFVRSDKVERSNRYLYDGEAILVPGEGRLGEIFHYINGKFDYHQRVYKISDFNGVAAKFVMYSMMRDFKKHALQNTAKATVDSIRLPTLTEFQLSLPKPEEQKKIGHYFSQIDSLITLHQRKLDHLKKLKKALLQQMFV